MANPLESAGVLQRLRTFSNAGMQRGSASDPRERTKAVVSPYEADVMGEDEALLDAADAQQRGEVEAQRRAQVQGFPSVQALSEYARRQQEAKLRQSAEAAQITAQSRVEQERLKQGGLEDRLRQLTEAVQGTGRSVSAAGVGSVGREPAPVKPPQVSAGTSKALRDARQVQGGPITSMQRFLHKTAPSMFGEAGEDVAVQEALLSTMRETGALDALTQVASGLRAGTIQPNDPLLGQLDPDEREALAVILERGGR